MWERSNRASKKRVHPEPDAILPRQRHSLNLVFSRPSGPRRMAYLFFCSPARLLRHSSRHRERIITIPIMATPSFMPNQMESNGSTVHLSQRVARHFVEMPNLPLNASIMRVSFGKRDGT